MADFKPRLTKPQGINIYYNRMPNGISRCVLGNNNRGQRDPFLNVLPNCVGWALGRLAETNGKWIGISGNASDFIKNCSKAGLTYQLTPTLGGIMVWSGGKSGAGHVAFVEQINKDGSVLCSESEWNGKVFATYRRKPGINKDYISGCGWMENGNYKYLGCINNPAVMEEDDMITDIKIKDADTGEIYIVKGIYKDGRNYIQLADLADKQYALVGWDGEYPVLTRVRKCCCGK